jgi:hypothetical protein
MYSRDRLRHRYNWDVLRWTWLPYAISCTFACSLDHGVPAGGAGAGGAETVDGGPRDSGNPTSDSMMVTPGDAQQCWTAASVSVNICLTAPLGGAVTIAQNTTIDTDTTGNSPISCRQLVMGSSNVCVIAASTITINSGRTLSASGAKPLVLLATSIIVNGTIDVASHRGGQTGAGANMVGCTSGNDNPSDAGGGQGGSFGARGGSGGDQDGQSNSGGSSGNMISSAQLRGGCSGTNGANGGGGRGDGGGAVLLLADTITFGSNAVINASGESGGGGGDGRRGGGGAGSGGMIALFAMTIDATSQPDIFANGGHGGGGSNNDNSGTAGSDSTSPSSSGSGGGAPQGAGSGGDAYPGNNLDGNNGTSGGGGGGGGGGGAGVIRNVSTSSLGANVSPAPT